ncbi:MAG: hypothetical protein KC486_09470 [Myxococcales bacterium]|nr:hypothetical protein [Myxococcales bacterium]
MGRVLPGGSDRRILSGARAFPGRLLLVYLGLYVAPFPFDHLPVLGPLVSGGWRALWGAVVPWFGEHVMAIDRARIVDLPSGSGDTTFKWVRIAVFAAVAVVVAGLWTLRARGRDPARARLWIRILVRYNLAAYMLSYGLAKVLVLQFQPPTLDRLVQRFGDASPMGLLWTFMGYSPAYTIFTGALEVLGGLLLLSRRTALAGALLLVGVLANVVMLNLCYDVPVKQFSIHLLAMSLVLLAPQRRRLWGLASGAALPASTPEEPFPSPRGRRRWRIFAAALGLGLIAVQLQRQLGFRARWAATAAPSPLSGLYDVDSLLRRGEPVEPYMGSRWRWIVFDRRGDLTILHEDGAETTAYAVVDEAAQTITLKPRRAPRRSPSGTLRYTLSPAGVLDLVGELSGSDVEVRARRVDPERFLLTRQRFRWVQESPFNR